MVRPRNMMEVKREDLYTNLEARIRYLHSFIDFTSNDIEALKSGAKYIKQLIPAVVNIVYKKLLTYDITARAFTTRSTSFEGPIDDVPDENSPQILHRKMFLRAYLAKLCSDPTQLEFWEYLDKVGMMHVGLGRAHPLHIEYIHLGICLGFIQDLLTEAILSHPKLLLSRKIALVKAIGKVIWIQNDLMAKWHIEDGDDFKKSDKEFIIENEGFLHGKKILHGDNENHEESDEAEEEGRKTPQPKSPSRIPRPTGGANGESVCPFSGMTISEHKKDATEDESAKAGEATQRDTPEMELPQAKEEPVAQS